ncbi:MAG: HAMP domain-containing histidine kinase [Bdellovibrionales bacterium]|nr:HAMP domain-containing histidine kinase [Bdellovibrionales bacterium]
MIAGTLIVAWAVFTVSLTVWWYIFSVKQLERLSQSGQLFQDGTLAHSIIREQKMLLWEGAALILSLLVGAAALAYFVWRDFRNSRQLMDFFLTFTHELKTPISNLRLCAEMVTDKFTEDSQGKELAEQLQAASDGIALQLDNSLTLAQLDGYRLFIEPLTFSEVLRPILNEFPGLEVSTSGECRVHGDAQAVSIIIRNLFKNSVTHGKAHLVNIDIQPSSNHHVKITFTDNGTGMQGERKKLGARFSRLYSGSGSGIGLFLSTELARKCGGSLTFPDRGNGGNGFIAILHLRGECK